MLLTSKNWGLVQYIFQWLFFSFLLCKIIDIFYYLASPVIGLLHVGNLLPIDNRDRLCSSNHSISISVISLSHYHPDKCWHLTLVSAIHKPHHHLLPQWTYTNTHTYSDLNPYTHLFQLIDISTQYPFFEVKWNISLSVMASTLQPHGL